MSRSVNMIVTKAPIEFRRGDPTRIRRAKHEIPYLCAIESGGGNERMRVTPPGFEPGFTG